MTEAHALSPKAARVADWLERLALKHATALGLPALREAGAAAGYSETDVAMGLTTMGRRAALLDSAYPFRTGSGIAARERFDQSPWTALLLMSTDSPIRALVDLPLAAANLERITVAALSGFYGPETRAVRFAWPSDDGRPQEFGAAVRWLAGRMGVAAGSAYRPPHAKDGGVDVVAWRPFPDRRSGFPVMLVQCTLERAYEHKAADIDLPIWSGWLRLDVPPTTALAIPDVVPSGEPWNDLAARTVILDRTRLVSLIASSRPDVRVMKEGLRAWTAEAVDLLRGLE